MVVVFGIILLIELAKAVGEAFQKGALAQEGGLRRLSAGLDLDGGRVMFEAEKQRAGIFEILRKM